jgi:hypothetical protein
MIQEELFISGSSVIPAVEVEGTPERAEYLKQLREAGYDVSKFEGLTPDLRGYVQEGGVFIRKSLLTQAKKFVEEKEKLGYTPEQIKEAGMHAKIRTPYRAPPLSEYLKRVDFRIGIDINLGGRKGGSFKSQEQFRSFMNKLRSARNAGDIFKAQESFNDVWKPLTYTTTGLGVAFLGTGIGAVIGVVLGAIGMGISKIVIPKEYKENGIWFARHKNEVEALGAGYNYPPPELEKPILDLIKEQGFLGISTKMSSQLMADIWNGIFESGTGYGGLLGGYRKQSIENLVKKFNSRETQSRMRSTIKRAVERQTKMLSSIFVCGKLLTDGTYPESIKKAFQELTNTILNEDNGDDPVEFKKKVQQQFALGTLQYNLLNNVMIKSPNFVRELIQTYIDKDEKKPEGEARINWKTPINEKILANEILENIGKEIDPNTDGKIFAKTVYALNHLGYQGINDQVDAQVFRQAYKDEEFVHSERYVEVVGKLQQEIFETRKKRAEEEEARRQKEGGETPKPTPTPNPDEDFYEETDKEGSAPRDLAEARIKHLVDTVKIIRKSFPVKAEKYVEKYLRFYEGNYDPETTEDAAYATADKAYELFKSWLEKDIQGKSSERDEMLAKLRKQREEFNKRNNITDTPKVDEEGNVLETPTPAPTPTQEPEQEQEEEPSEEEKKEAEKTPKSEREQLLTSEEEAHINGLKSIAELIKIIKNPVSLGTLRPSKEFMDTVNEFGLQDELKAAQEREWYKINLANRRLKEITRHGNAFLGYQDEGIDLEQLLEAFSDKQNKEEAELEERLKKPVLTNRDKETLSSMEEKVADVLEKEQERVTSNEEREEGFLTPDEEIFEIIGKHAEKLTPEAISEMINNPEDYGAKEIKVETMPSETEEDGEIPVLTIDTETDTISIPIPQVKGKEIPTETESEYRVVNINELGRDDRDMLDYLKRLTRSINDGEMLSTNLEDYRVYREGILSRLSENGLLYVMNFPEEFGIKYITPAKEENRLILHEKGGTAQEIELRNPVPLTIEQEKKKSTQEPTPAPNVSLFTPTPTPAPEPIFPTRQPEPEVNVNEEDIGKTMSALDPFGKIKSGAQWLGGKAKAVGSWLYNNFDAGSKKVDELWENWNTPKETEPTPTPMPKITGTHIPKVDFNPPFTPEQLKAAGERVDKVAKEPPKKEAKTVPTATPKPTATATPAPTQSLPENWGSTLTPPPPPPTATPKPSATLKVEGTHKPKKEKMDTETMAGLKMEQTPKPTPEPTPAPTPLPEDEIVTPKEAPKRTEWYNPISSLGAGVDLPKENMVKSSAETPKEDDFYDIFHKVVEEVTKQARPKKQRKESMWKVKRNNNFINPVRPTSPYLTEMQNQLGRGIR